MSLAASIVAGQASDRIVGPFTVNQHLTPGRVANVIVDAVALQDRLEQRVPGDHHQDDERLGAKAGGRVVVHPDGSERRLARLGDEAVLLGQVACIGGRDAVDSQQCLEAPDPLGLLRATLRLDTEPSAHVRREALAVAGGVVPVGDLQLGLRLAGQPAAVHLFSLASVLFFPRLLICRLVVTCHVRPAPVAMHDEWTPSVCRVCRRPP